MVFTLPVVAEGANLGPTKASQLVTVQAFGPCPIPLHTGSNSLRLSRMIDATGAATNFVIPAKKVFVMSDAIVSTGAVSVGNVLASTIVVGTAAGGVEVAARFDTAATNGTATATFTFPTGIAVRSGATVCIEMLNFSAGGFVGLVGYVHGYFAPDK